MCVGGDAPAVWSLLSQQVGKETVTRWCAIILIGSAVFAGCGPPPEGELVFRDGRWIREAAPIEGTAAGELALVRLHVKEGRNRKAIRAAERFLKRYPDDLRGERVLLEAAQAYVNRGRYMKAYDWYERLLDLFPAGEYFERVVEREFEIAEAFLAGKRQWVWGFLPLGAESEALEILTKVAEHAPGSIIAENALLRIADYHFEDRSYARAAEAYDQYLELFAKSARAPHAMLRAAESIYATFRGIAYDDTPLVEADLRMQIFQQSYPQAARAAGVGQTLQTIASLRAEKDYTTSIFYERISRPEAAEFYYRQVVEHYG